MIAALLLVADLVAQAGPAASPLPSRIDAVLVLGDHAQVTRVATVRLDGPRWISFELLPGGIDPRTVRLSASGAAVDAVETRPERAPGFSLDEARELLRKLEGLDDQLAALSALRADLEEQAKLLAELRPELPPDAAGLLRPKISPVGYRGPLQFLSDELAERKARLRELSQRARKLQRERDALRLRAAEIAAAEPKEGLRVRAHLAGAGSARLSLEYQVEKAGWIPRYELQFSPATGQLALSLQAQVEQHSGEDWTFVRLSASTAPPSEPLRLPELWTWKIGAKESFEPRPSATVRPAPAVPLRWTEGYGPSDERAREEAELIGQLRGLAGGPNSGFSINGAASAEASEVAEDAHFSVPGEADNLEKTAPSAGSPPPAPPAGHLAAKMAAPRQAPREAFGAGLQPPPAFEPPGPPPGSPNALAGGAALTFSARQPATLPTLGGPQRIPLYTGVWPARVIRRLWPALTPEARLLAQVRSPLSSALPGGQADLSVGADPTGQAQLDLLSPGAEFSLPLGVDRAVRSVRNVSQLQVEEGLFHKDEVTDYRVDLEVENPYRQAIDIEVVESYPMASGKDVSVELHDVGAGAERDAGRGLLTWKLKLPAQSQRALHYFFRIRRPKGYRLHQ